MDRLGSQKSRIQILVVLVAVLAGLCPLCPGPPAWSQDKDLVLLYFPKTDRPALGLEQREVERAAALTGWAKNAVRSLLSGPRTELAPLFKPGVDLRQVFVDQAGTAFVDLSVQAGGQGGVGAVQERLGLWALVNTLCLNFKEIKAVKVLVNGGEAPALFGHVDISRPLLPDESLIK